MDLVLFAVICLDLLVFYYDFSNYGLVADLQ